MKFNFCTVVSFLSVISITQVVAAPVPNLNDPLVQPGSTSPATPPPASTSDKKPTNTERFLSTLDASGGDLVDNQFLRSLAKNPGLTRSASAPVIGNVDGPQSIPVRSKAHPNQPGRVSAPARAMALDSLKEQASQDKPKPKPKLGGLPNDNSQQGETSQSGSRPVDISGNNDKEAKSDTTLEDANKDLGKGKGKAFVKTPLRKAVTSFSVNSNPYTKLKDEDDTVTVTANPLHGVKINSAPRKPKPSASEEFPKPKEIV